MEEETNQNPTPEQHPHVAWRIVIVAAIIAIVGGVGYFIFRDSFAKFNLNSVMFYD